jgi:hypothetical protein
MSSRGSKRSCLCSQQVCFLPPDRAILSRHQTCRFAWVHAWPSTEPCIAQRNIHDIRLAAMAHAMLVAQLPSSLHPKPCRPTLCHAIPPGQARAIAEMKKIERGKYCITANQGCEMMGSTMQPDYSMGNRGTRIVGERPTRSWIFP